MQKRRFFNITDENGKFNNVPFQTGQILVVTGPNGVGKSSLLDEISTGLGTPSEVELFIGHRAISFSSDDIDSIGMNFEMLRVQMRTNPQHANRYRNPWGEQHLKSVVRRIQQSQAQSTDNFIKRVKEGIAVGDADAANPRIIDQVNSIFASAKLAIRLGYEGGHLKATRGGNTFGLEKLSDGERASLLLSGAILVQQAHSFIVVDEPERHLNPAICGPLVAAAVRARSDLGIVFATHDLQLIEWLRPDKILHIQDSIVIRSEPELRHYKFSAMDAGDGVEESLKYSIMGSRKAVLLVEGDSSSEDQALYSLIYPGWYIVARGGWETIAGDVRALQSHSNYHWLTVAGLIDSDGRTQDEKEKLSNRNVFSLPTPTVENLFFNPKVISCMANAMHALLGGPTGEQRVDALRAQLRNKIDRSKSEILARRIVWSANRLLSSRKVSVDNVRAGQHEIEGVNLKEIRDQIESEFNEIMMRQDLVDELSNLPIKNTGIPSDVAGLIGYPSFKVYKQAVLQQVESGSAAGVKILIALRTILPELHLPN